ncbi:MAG TPA: DUF4190 domain-containing protein [Blastocatellia bacterium]|nr:DUF4190 domain-containing protein [Blastocatellia bacterium]HMV83421.1 DUF4190 domain-containing protein [Blastocatellia bacterium]HMX24090.1 DUF4190 domain-containing protein [Blastocatellia bacterium]HMY75008.1 DUF4190 domain-containing protein [Blastocatellia bacterium]HMZ21152.1 DUF4190 domain-containing protein [Blastocatellia bacterium]
MSADFPSAKPRKGLAIASLVLGIISIPTLGLIVVGAITGIVLGVIALSKIKNNPQAYGGRNLAIAGIITSAVSLVLVVVWGILAAIAVPKLQNNLQQGREFGAIKTLESIHVNQAQFNAMKGKFGTLAELNQAGLLDSAYSNDQIVAGYRYSVSDVSNDTFCVHADRSSDSVAGKDFMICEDGVIRYVESKTKGTVKRGEGTLLRELPSAPGATP